VKIYPTFYEKSFKKGTLNPKFEKGLCNPYFTVFVRIFAGEKIANFSPFSQ